MAGIPPASMLLLPQFRGFDLGNDDPRFPGIGFPWLSEIVKVLQFDIPDGLNVLWNLTMERPPRGGLFLFRPQRSPLAKARCRNGDSNCWRRSLASPLGPPELNKTKHLLITC
jgi:hypothetical protein